jgi:NADH-quinone oxidoreductase subunit M
MPLVGAALTWLTPKSEHVRWIALLSAIVELAIALYLVATFDTSLSGFQFVERYEWIPTLNAQYIVGIDGISVLFLPLTALLFIGVIITSWQNQEKMPRLYFTLLLMLTSVTMGIFCALDGILFFLFWEMTLAPLFLLNTYWGSGAYRRYADIKYTMYMLIGGAFLLFGFLLLALNHASVAGGFSGGLTFDYVAWLTTPIDAKTQTLIFILLFLGFSVKVPIVPFHTWLPIEAMEGAIPVGATIMGLKLGAYGLIRFVFPLVPDAAIEFKWLPIAIGAIGMLYAAIVALAQTNLRRMLAYSSVSHVGLVLVGIGTLSQEGLQGAVYQLLNFIIASGGLALLTAFLYQRIGSTDVIALGGVARSMPALSGMFLLFGLASMGIPGTSGFPGEFLLLFSAFKINMGAAAASLVAVILGTAYFIVLYRKAFMGPASNPIVRDSIDLRKRELVIMLAIGLLILLGGFFPSYALQFIENASRVWAKRFI